MKKQTFIVSTWYGATSYIEAARKEANEGYNPEKYGHDFYRLSCKKLETALKYLSAWTSWGSGSIQTKGEKRIEAK